MVALSALTSILLPLYIFPTASTPWTDIFTNITAHPDVHFDVIINPDTGPGVQDTGTFPDPAYIDSIAQLNAFPNTQLFGYIHTSYAQRPLTEVITEIAEYEAWDTYTLANISLKGIFFDEAPSINNPGNITYMKHITNCAHDAGFPSVIFNPGDVADAAYYDIADNIVMFENVPSQFTPSIVSQIAPEHLNKTSFIMYGLNGTSADQLSLLEEVAPLGLKGFYITDAFSYGVISPLWGDFVTDFSQIQVISR